MATVKFYLRKKVLADGTSPLVLKIFKDGKPSISHTEISLFHKDWDAKKRRLKTSHPNYTRLDNLLLKKLAEANDKAIEVQTNNSIVSAKTLIQKIKPKSGLSFLAFSKIYAERLKKADKYTERNSSIASSAHFKNFLKGSDIVFHEITTSLLERYKKYLSNEVKIGKEEKNMAAMTVFNNLAFIRTIFNHAIEEGIVDKKYYPFGPAGMDLRMPETSKVGLAISDVTLIESIELTNPKYNHARNLWLISFYFGGMRASDVLCLKWSDFNNNRLHYKMSKNGKAGSLKTSEKVADILLQYEADKRFEDDFVFPELKKLPDLRNKFLVKKYISSTVSAISGVLRLYVGPLAQIL